MRDKGRCQSKLGKNDRQNHLGITDEQQRELSRRAKRWPS
jgi:hypothetical protein